VVVIASLPGAMVNWNEADADAPPWSATLTVKLLEAANVGVPLSMPAELSVNPCGIVPLFEVQFE
jgi:hypothetical protein